MPRSSLIAAMVRYVLMYNRYKMLWFDGTVSRAASVRDVGDILANVGCMGMDVHEDWLVSGGFALKR